MLRRRIGSIRDDKLIDPEVARHLMEKNQADDANRANRIHFCFFEPHMAGETGINSLLRYWGGEALYNSHDADPVRGPVLAKVGIPCLVEADVPIVDLKGIFLDINVSRQFLIWRGLRPLEIIKHSDCAVRPVRSLRRVVQFPESDFIALTQCETWETPLT